MIYVYILIAALWAGSTGVAYFKGKMVAQEECDYENIRKELKFQKDLTLQLQKSLAEANRLNAGYEQTIEEQEQKFEELEKELEQKAEGSICVDEKFMRDLGAIK